MIDLSLIGDLWENLPKELKFIFAISVFLFAGSTILQVIVFLWNLLGVNAMNAINGCIGGNTAVCIPNQEGIFIFGINFADYWTIVVLIMFPTLIVFALKWYSMFLKTKGD